MPHSRQLGNDVVDRTDPRCQGKVRDLRFLRRVFSQEEQDVILAAPDQELALWLHWAAKESAFKSASKTLGSPPVFNHPLFRVSGIETQGDAEFSGQISFQELAFSLRAFVTPAAIHAVTWVEAEGSNAPESPISPPPPFEAGLEELPRGGEDWRERLRRSLTPMEWGCVSHEASALTRIAAKEALATALEVDPDALEIGCGPGLPSRRIPLVFLHGELSTVDLSLSHHGRFQAWVFQKV